MKEVIERTRKRLSARLIVPLLAVVSIIFISIVLLNSDAPRDRPEAATLAIAPEIMCFADDADTLTASEILAIPDDKFQANDGTVPNFGFFKGAVWMLFSVSNDANAVEERIVEVKSPNLNRFEVYEINGDGLKLLALTGDDEPFDSRPVLHRNYQFEISLSAGEGKRFLVKATTAGEQLLLPVKIWTHAELDSRDHLDTLIRGSYFGLIVFVLIFNLFIFIIIKEKSSLYYLLYNLTLLLLQLSLSGLAFQYLWPSGGYLANVANPVLASLSVFALTRFSQQFLNLKVHYYWINRIFDGLGMILLINVVFALIYTKPFFFLSIIAVNGLALVLNLCIIPVAIMVWRKNFKPAKFFLVGFIVLVLTVFAFLLTNFGILPNEFVADYGLLVGSAAEVILLSFAIVDRFKSFRDDALSRLVEINKITVENNAQLEYKVKLRTEEIEMKKEELLSSIRYAERIQKNILPTEEKVRQLFPQAFVYFQPKDIVSGDFYWVAKTTTTVENEPPVDLLLFATADCTGHGVPGAFMSLLGFNLLERSLAEPFVNSPGDALNFLHDEVVSSLHHEKSGYALTDGMDILLCALEPVSRTLHYSGANNKLVIYRNGEIIELQGERRGVGQVIEGHSFASNTINLCEGDILYSFSDGFKDQFGGERARKLKWSGFREILKEIGAYSIEEQKRRLSDFFEIWRGDIEQVDDVCVMAVRVQ